MKIVKYLFLINLIKIIQPMDNNAITTLENKAWQHAFNGERSQAITVFNEAANRGSWEAAKFLEYNYGKESLLDEMNDAKSKFFYQQAEAIKKKRQNVYLSEWGLESKIKKLKALQFAINNPWYKQILNELNGAHLSYAQTFPLPQDGILALFNGIKSCDNVQKSIVRAQLFGTIVEYISQDTLQAICKKISDNYDFPTFSDNQDINYNLGRLIIMSLDKAACRLGLLEELKRIYAKLFSYYYHDWLWDNKVKRDSIVDLICELWPRYAALDRSQATETLFYFLNHDIKSSWKIDKPFLRLLRLLSNEELDIYATKLIPDNLKYFVNALCKNPEEAQSFQGTLFDLDAIIIKLLRSNLDEPCVKALIAFFENGNTVLYKKHEDDIVATLPKFMEKEPYAYMTVISMMTQRDSSKLQHQARKTLIEYTAHTTNSFLVSHIIEDIFKNSYFEDIERKFLYEIMNTVYQEKKNIKGLQLLWMHLKDIPEHKDFLYKSVMQYFGVPSDTQITTDSFSDFLNKILMDGLNKNISKKQFLDTLKVAHETKLSELIEPKFLSLEKDRVIFDEQVPFKERAIFLDQRLLNIQSGAEMSEFAQRLNSAISSEDFRIYARDILITLRTNSSSFEVCKAKKSLQEMYKKYDLNRSMPEIVWKISGDLPNFNYYWYKPVHERPTNRIVLSDSFTKPYICNDGLIYGLSIKNMKCSLCAIDEKTLDAVWQVPIKNYEHVQGKEPKFIVHNEIIYLVDGNVIRCFYKKTGNEFGCHELQNKLPVISFKIDIDGLLYVVHGESDCDNAIVVTIDPQTGNNTIIENNIDKGGKRYFTAGKTFGYYYMPDKTITLYSKNKSKCVISTCMDKETGWFFDSYLAIKDSQIIFQKCISKDNYQLILYDTLTNSEKWNLPLLKRIIGKPCISKDGKRIYIINEKNKIIAIENDDYNPKPIWTFEVHNGIEELAVVPNGKILYAISRHGGELYAINTANGALISDVKCEEGRARYLVGVSPEGLPYIHPVYY